MLENCREQANIFANWQRGKAKENGNVAVGVDCAPATATATLVQLETKRGAQTRLAKRAEREGRENQRTVCEIRDSCFNIKEEW